MSLLLYLLRIESEDNAALCMKVIIDLHRTYSRPPSPSSSTGQATANADAPTTDPTVAQIEQSVDEFLEIVAELFKNMGSVVEETFRDSGSRISSRTTLVCRSEMTG